MALVLLVFYIFQLLTTWTNSQTCKSNSNLPLELQQHQAIYWNGSVYIFGGRTVSGNESHAIYKWDLNETNSSFIKIGSTPTYYFFSESNNAVLLNDIVYFVGLEHDDSYTEGNIYRYNLSSQTWIDSTQLNPPLHPRVHGCLATNGTHLFLVDGTTGMNTNTSFLQIYNVATNEWIEQQTPPKHTEWVKQYCFAIDDALFVFGGYYGNIYRNIAYKYDLLNASWHAIGSLPYVPWAGTAVYYDDYIYLVGSDADTNHIIVFDLKKEIIALNMTVIIDPVHDAASVVANGELFIFGGSFNHTPTASIQRCDLYAHPTHYHSSVIPTNNSLLTTFISTMTTTKYGDKAAVDQYTTTVLLYYTDTIHTNLLIDSDLTTLWIIIGSSIIALCIIIIFIFLCGNKRKEKIDEMQQSEQNMAIKKVPSLNYNQQHVKPVINNDIEELEMIEDERIIAGKEELMNMDTNASADDMKHDTTQEECVLRQWVIFNVRLPIYVYYALIKNGYTSLQFVKEITSRNELNDIGILNEHHQEQMMTAIQELKYEGTQTNNGTLDETPKDAATDNEQQQEENGEAHQYEGEIEAEPWTCTQTQFIM